MNVFGVALIFVALLSSSPADARIKRSQSAKIEFKQQQPCPATGLPYGPCKGYVIDHINPLACGGADASVNMQWQTIEDAKAKDKWERRNPLTCVLAAIRTRHHKQGQKIARMPHE